MAAASASVAAASVAVVMASVAAAVVAPSDGFDLYSVLHLNCCLLGFEH